jgi:glycosyltransferase involved in cell wall biosynthesis
MHLISVVLPVRPECKTLVGSLNSIIQQEYTNYQIVAVLDRDLGSNEAVLRNTVAAERLKVVHVDYQAMGFAAMLNAGIEASDGEYIARHDDDDIASEGRFSMQIDAFQDDESLGLVTGWAEVVTPTGENKYWIKPPKGSQEISHALLTQNVIPHSSVMFKKDIWRKVDGYQIGMISCEDYDLWLRMVPHARFFGIQQKLVTYLSNPEGMTTTPIPKTSIMKMRDSRKVAQEFLQVKWPRTMLQNLKWEAGQ